MNVVSAIDTMTDHFYTFDASPERQRRLGSRGGRAFGRNQRARRALLATLREVVPLRAVLPATAAESIAILDVRFPWLRGVEKRPSLKPASTPVPYAPASQRAFKAADALITSLFEPE
jgi:hypothetical protein